MTACPLQQQQPATHGTYLSLSPLTDFSALCDVCVPTKSLRVQIFCVRWSVIFANVVIIVNLVAMPFGETFDVPPALLLIRL